MTVPVVSIAAKRTRQRPKLLDAGDASRVRTGLADRGRVVRARDAASVPSIFLPVAAWPAVGVVLAGKRRSPGHGEEE